MRKILIISSLALGACSSDTGDVTALRFSDDVTLVTKISGAGGALGDETYRISYRYAGEEQLFFEGVNPHGFQITKAGDDAVEIRFCDGTVHLAQPIFLGPPRSKLIHLELNLGCQNRSG